MSRTSSIVILGVDPGTLITGYGLIEVNAERSSLVSYDIIQNSPDSSMPQRLKMIYTTLCDVIKKHKPNEVAVETAFYGKNVQSALKLGQARGVSMLAAVVNQLPLAEYTPREIKKSITGNGGATKQQVQYMVKSYLRLRTVPKHFDMTDALAIALCHSFRLHQPLVIKSNKPKTWEQYIRMFPERVVNVR